MPHAYTSMRDRFRSEGESEPAAKRKAARIYISRSSSKRGRSARARSLQADRRSGR